MNQINNDQESAGKKDNLPSTHNQLIYSSIISSWNGAVGSQHKLLSGYIMAHSFLIAGIVLLFTSFERQPNIIINISILLLSGAGLLLSLQMALAWGRFVARVFLLEWHLQRIEKQKSWYGPTPFKDWAELRANPRINIIDPKDNANQFYANWAVRHNKKRWAPRARIIPVLTAIIYLFYLSVSVYKLVKGC